MSTNRRNKLAESYFTKIKSWLLRNIAWLIPTIISCILGWIQFHKCVEADVIAPVAYISTDNPQQTVFEIPIVINNSGNQGLALIHADPYIRYTKDPSVPPMPLLHDGKNQIFIDNEIKAGSFKTFLINVYVNKTFTTDTQIKAQKEYGTDGTIMGVEIGILLYSTDKKFYGATTEKLDIKYLNGHPINVIRKLKPVNFEFVDSTDMGKPINLNFAEPLK